MGRILFGVVLAVGIGLRLVQVLRNSPLWLDELALTNGLLNGSFTGLFDGPSDFAQVAPPGFLALEWAIARLFPDSDLALRVPSLLFGSAAIAATWMTAREITGERYAWVPAGLVAVAAALIFLSGQVKPYAADAFFTPLILACALRHDRVGTPASWRALVAAGAIGPLFSLGAVFAIAGAWMFLSTQRGVSWKALAGLVVVWGAIAVVSVVMSHRLLSQEANELMSTYWRPYYPPFPPTSLTEAKWYSTSVLDLLWTMMGFRGVWLFGLGLLAGVAVAWRLRPGASLLLALPLIAVMIAAIIRQYPFGQRLLHWTAPLFALLLGVAASVIANWLSRRWRPAAFLPGAFLLVTPVLSLAQDLPPYVRDDIEPAIRRLSEAAQPGDVVYVGWSAWHSWQRYGPRVKAPLGDVVIGSCALEYPRGYLRDLDTLRGRPRAWLLFTRVGENERPAHHTRLTYLDTIGVRAESLVVAIPGVSQSAEVDLYRYDLSDSTRLASATAGLFPIAPELIGEEHGCRETDAMYRLANGRHVVPLR